MSTPPLQLRDRAPDRDVVGVEHDAEGEVVDGDEDDRVETLLAELRRHPEVKRLVPGLEREVEAGKSTPAAAARRMLEVFHGR